MAEQYGRTCPASHSRSKEDIRLLLPTVCRAFSSPSRSLSIVPISRQVFSEIPSVENIRHRCLKISQACAEFTRCQQGGSRIRSMKWSPRCLSDCAGNRRISHSSVSVSVKVVGAISRVSGVDFMPAPSYMIAGHGIPGGQILCASLIHTQPDASYVVSIMEYPV